MTEQELKVILKKIKFYIYWFLPDSEVRIREFLVDKIISAFRNNNPTLDYLLTHPKISAKIEFAHTLAYLRPVSDKDLIKFVLGIIELVYYFTEHVDSHIENASDLMSESIRIVSEYYKSEEYKEHLLSNSITGEERFDSEGIIVPFSLQNLMMHIKRMGIHPLNRKDIDIVKSDFANYNRQLYHHNKDKETKTIFKPKDLTVINEIYQITRGADIIKIDIHDFLLAVLQADFSGIEQRPKYKIQHLVYVLSRVMEKEWYNTVLVSVGWGKSQCSGHGVKLENDIWGKKINKILDQLDRLSNV